MERFPYDKPLAEMPQPARLSRRARRRLAENLVDGVTADLKQQQHIAGAAAAAATVAVA